MKRIAAALFFFAVFLYNGSAHADAAAAAVIEARTGRVLYAQNADMQLPMASTTKVMTALLAIENCRLDETVTASEHAFGVPGTSIYLTEGESLTMEQMLYGLMLASGNDAAVAIAEHVGGSIDQFCALMNARAAELGCSGTHYATPHGLPAQNHYTTALDLCTIARQAMTYPFFRQVVSTQRATIPWQNHDYDRVLNNKNKLLSTYPGAIGVKTGYTKAAGRCLVFAAQRDGMEVIGAVLNCPDWFDQSAALLDQAFADYHMYTALRKNEIVYRLPVKGGVTDGVDVVTGDILSAPLEAGESAEISFRWPESLDAGFEKDRVIGSAALIVNGETLCTVPLLTAEAVPQSTFLYGVGRTLDQWLAVGN